MSAASEDPGLLGGLPRSRPGTRSQKRADAPQRPRTEPPPRPHSRAAPAETPGTDDPIEAVGRAAGRIAGAGLRVAGRLTGEAIKRLPRP